jgi:hypothetical protein
VNGARLKIDKDLKVDNNFQQKKPSELRFYDAPRDPVLFPTQARVLAAEVKHAVQNKIKNKNLALSI